MNISIERKRSEYSSLNNKPYSREINHHQQKLQNPAPAPVEIYYGSQSNKSIERESDIMDLTKMDPSPPMRLHQTPNPSSQLFVQHAALKRQHVTSTLSPISSLNLNVSLAAPNSPKHHQQQILAQQQQFDLRNIRTDSSLVCPIRQTASIFKQPVTVVKTQSSKMKGDLKHGLQEKPKQLFWEKRLENLQACDSDGNEFDSINLPRQLKPVGPHVKEQTLFQSVTTALHTAVHPITGQTYSKSALSTNPGAFLNPDQPLLYAITICDDDIRKQEDRVTLARKKLQDALLA